MRKEIDPILLLAVLALAFGLLLIGVDWFFKGEGEVFQVMASAFTGTLGALLLALKQKAGINEHPPAAVPPPATPGGPNA